MIDGVRLSEGLTSKRWTVEKSNIRRSIGLYLWDTLNLSNAPKKSRKKQVQNVIDEIKSENPEILDLYLGNFNKHNSIEKTTKFGDSAKSLEVVIREMEADYDLTDCCIKSFEYLTPYNVKTRGALPLKK